MLMVHCACYRMYCTCYRAAVGLLKGRVASEASYPAWLVVETSRPKVLVFLQQNHLFWGESAFKIYAHANHIALAARASVCFKINWQFRWLTLSSR